MADNTNWDKTIPSGTSSIANGDDEIRSMKSILQAAWEDEHYFTDGSSSSAGEHKLGSARVYSGGVSSVSTAADTGRLMWTTDAEQLFHVGHGSINTLPSLGTTNTFLSQQSFDAGILASDVTARDYVSASTVTATDSHVSRVIASQVSTPSITGLNAISASTITATSLMHANTLEVGSGSSTLALVLSLTTQLSKQTIGTQESAILQIKNDSGITSGDALSLGIGNLGVSAGLQFTAGINESLGSIILNIYNPDNTNDASLDTQDVTFVAIRSA